MKCILIETDLLCLWLYIFDNLNIVPFLQGLDVFNYVQVKTQITGSIPTISVGSEIEMDAFDEEYTRVKPGKVMPC